MSPKAFFGSELRRCRKKGGLSQAQLGERTTYSPDMIGKIERGERPPSAEFVKQCDEIFGIDGHFDRLYQFMLQTPGPAWFTRWLEEIEPRATVLRTWDPLLVPGLLQTEAYARHIFAREPKITPEEVEERLQARMLRKTVLDRGDPPAVWVLLDEGVLLRSIGGPQVIGAQMEHLLVMAQRSNVVIQIVPFAAESTVGLTGAFILAELPGGEPDAVYVESSVTGEVTTEHEIVASVWSRYDTIRADAYPQHVSLKMIQDGIDRWSAATVNP